VKIPSSSPLGNTKERAEGRRVTGHAVATSHTLIAPDLTPEVLSDSAARAWSALLSAPSTHVVLPAAGPPARVEISP